MDMRTRTILLWSGVAILIIAGVAALSISFGGSKDTAVEDVNAIYTNAASTVAAQQQTLQAGMLSPTPNPTLSSPTAALTALPIQTFQQQAPALLPTSALAAGGTTTGGAVGCDNAVYISDATIPDGSTIPAGQYFTKTWKVSNTGSCEWTATYQLVFISGDSLGGKATAIGKVVKPGESADVSVVLTSSSATGEIKGTWRLSNDKSQPFGDSLTVLIKSGTTGTVSATPTKTPTGQVAATLTPTPASAVTVIVVTATYTPTPIPTTPVPPNIDTPIPTPTPTYIPVPPVQ